MSENSQLTDRLLTKRETREAYVRAKVTTNVPSQIKALRRRQGDMTQAQLAEEADMLQSRISTVEKPGARLNLDTLVRLAAAFRVALLVKFVSYSEMLRWENEFSQDAFNVIPIDEDVDFLKEEEPTESASPQSGFIPTKSVLDVDDQEQEQPDQSRAAFKANQADRGQRQRPSFAMSANA
jgi:transcriptional regulator with XRE-family HTH domain